jgi:hypothetical protein
VLADRGYYNGDEVLACEGRAPCRGSCAQPRASRACGTVKIGALRRSRCFSPSTIALLKASTRPT